jgi:hypothetical protein
MYLIIKNQNNYDLFIEMYNELFRLVKCLKIGHFCYKM